MAISKVAIIGANGRLGPAVLHALVSEKSFTITVLSRSSSKSKYTDSVHVTYISDDPPIEELVQIIQGQDALIVTTAGSESALQIRLADAAAQAGVRRFIPADFGSCDSNSPRALELMPLYREKQKVRQHLQELASASSLSWTSLVCGHFFDYGLKSGLLQFDIDPRKARIFDSGETKWSATTIETIATAVVRVLQKEDETRNRMLYIQSFCITQIQVLKSLERITGQKWQVEHLDSEKYIREMKREVDSNPENAEARENLVSVVGIVDANWEGKDDFANALLGLEDEDLNQVVQKVVES
jgi:putative NADH-flavin reductase